MNMKWTGLTAVAVVALAGCSSSPPTAASRKTFVDSIAHDSRVVAAGTQSLMIEMGMLAKATDPATQAADVSQLGADAQQLHDNLANFYDEVIADAAIGDDTELSVGTAAGELRDAAGSLASWSKNPTAAGAQAAVDAFTPAVSDWDSAVAAAWKAAGVATPPTINSGA